MSGFAARGHGGSAKPIESSTRRRPIIGGVIGASIPERDPEGVLLATATSARRGGMGFPRGRFLLARSRARDDDDVYLLLNLESGDHIAQYAPPGWRISCAPAVLSIRGACRAAARVGAGGPGGHWEGTVRPTRDTAACGGDASAFRLACALVRIPCTYYYVVRFGRAPAGQPRARHVIRTFAEGNRTDPFSGRTRARAPT